MIERLRLRYQLVKLLTGQTMAENRVFDTSYYDEHSSSSKDNPIIVVYSETSEGQTFLRSGSDIQKISIEFSFIAKIKDFKGAYHQARLDLFEHQIRGMLSKQARYINIVDFKSELVTPQEKNDVILYGRILDITVSLPRVQNHQCKKGCKQNFVEELSKDLEDAHFCEYAQSILTAITT